MLDFVRQAMVSEVDFMKYAMMEFRRDIVQFKADDIVMARPYAGRIRKIGRVSARSYQVGSC